MGALLSNIIVFFFYLFHVITKYPYLNISQHFFDIRQLINILKTGIWVSISKLAAILLSTCSTYLVNIMINTYIAGIYGSIAQLQSVLSFMTVAIVNVFLPRMYKLYADKDYNSLTLYTEKSVKVISSILGIVVGGLIVFGNEFMSIWITADYLQYNLLIILSVCSLHISYSAELINQLLITVNKTRIPAFISLLAGIINIITAVFFISIMHNGVYGIAIAQLLVGVIRAGIILPFYAAIQLQKPWFIFIISQFKGCIPVVLVVLIGSVIASEIRVDSWITLIISACITGGVSLAILSIIDCDIRTFVFQFLKKRQ